MSDPQNPAHAAALRELVDEARRSGDSRSAPKRHHLVPAFYLNSWVDEGKIRVTDLDKHKTWTTTPRRAASENDYYRIESPDLDPEDVPPLLHEVVLSKVERWGADFISAAVDDAEAAIRQDEARVLFAHYMGFQYVRGRHYRSAQRAMATDMLKLTYGEITDEGIRHELAERGLDLTTENITAFRRFVDQLGSGELTVGPDQASMIGMSGELARDIGFCLFTRGWRIYRVPPVLLTCDEPVVPIAGPPHPRTEFGGVGAAGVVVFPLTPGLLLAMFDGINATPQPPHELGPGDVAQLNREIAAASTRYVFERPSQNLTPGMKLLPAPSPTSIAPPAPVDDEGMKHLIRTHRPSRWASSKKPPPWPVERWFHQTPSKGR